MRARIVLICVRWSGPANHRHRPRSQKPQIPAARAAIPGECWQELRGANGPPHGYAAGDRPDNAPGDDGVRYIGGDGRVRSRGDDARLYAQDFRRVECERAEPDFQDACAIARNQGRAADDFA